ncbi:hypothetical protein caldi_13530 [Caldinitratiruptor microaerophilus]|uniref:Uncharacterized protein n=1 Tax=Caldinitratiruptor microaerophilus TaxID=671077 RepID=A0AA35CKU0_9FIRM|nr:hypothetical protein caldi_13530 [Caldinitratiruptor microaerophilus]
MSIKGGRRNTRTVPVAARVRPWYAGMWWALRRQCPDMEPQRLMETAIELLWLHFEQARGLDRAGIIEEAVRAVERANGRRAPAGA